jgi:hypothetical protein
MELVQRPVYARDRNPQLAARLKGMIAEIDALLAADEE